MKKQLLMYTIAGLFLASCSTTIERNTTAFGGGWGMSEKKETYAKKQDGSVNATAAAAEKTNSLENGSINTDDQHAAKSSNSVKTAKLETLKVDPQIGKTKTQQNQSLTVTNKSISKSANQVIKSIPTQVKKKAEKIRKNAALSNSSGGGSGFSIASLVLGIIGLFRYGWLLGPLAIIFGIIGLNRDGRGMAIAGLILGIVDLILWILLVLLILLTL
jgi:hypothetical protein